MDSLRNTIQSMYANTKAAYDKIDEMGGELPANKNLQNLAEAIRSIPTGPAVPTSLEELKKMVNRGREIVVGTEIPDTYAGNSNPLIVAQNLNSTNNSSYGGAEGVILIRTYIEPISQIYSNTSSNYITSEIRAFLNEEYLNNCSDSLKSIISEIAIPWWNWTTVEPLSGDKWFLMSDYEVCSGLLSYQEGIMWELWKNRTGLSTPSSDYKAGRIIKDRDGTARYWWLRSSTSRQAYCITATGGGAYNSTSVAYGVLPACFIGKD